jgi:glycosyl transferase family 1
MKERIRTVIFYARGQTHWRRVVADTVVGALRLRPGMVPPFWRSHRHAQFLFDDENRVLSPYLDWKDAFAASPRLAPEFCNVNNVLEYRAGLDKLNACQLAVILHSAAWDDMAWLRRTQHRFENRRAKLLICFGNEYREMPMKIAFAQAVGADYIASQLPMGAARWLYAGCGATVLPAPAALNPALYRPPAGPRRIDIGFRGDLYDDMYALGDVERTTILRYFDEQAEQLGLTKDMAYVRLPREQWSELLGRWKGVAGAESGTYFLERDDHTQQAVVRYLKDHPAATFEDVHARFFRDYRNPVSGKAISSRHFEPIGTQTCQVLVEGFYNGILKADEHYIAVKKDLSNVREAVRRFKDEGYRRAMVQRAYEYVMDGHTYAHRVESLVSAMLSGGAPA